MKRTPGLLSGALALAVALPLGAQMMDHGARMGGGRRTIINLVSPADSPTQIRRGTVMFGQYMSNIGQPFMPGMPGASENGTRQARVMLRLYLSGVSDANGLITSGGNRFIFQGQLLTPTDGPTPVTIDQTFALNSGRALVQVPLRLPAFTGLATVTIDQVTVTDAHGSAVAVPGIALAQPTPQSTPQPTPEGSCTSDSGCDDGDPDTEDVCTPMGCQHMPDHMDHGMSSH
jgi:hypothetical protein